MTANVGWATLSVIPSFKGFQGQLERGMAAPMIAASSRAGSTSGAEAAKGFRSRFEGGMANFTPKLIAALGVAAVGKEIVSLQGDFESSMNVLAEAADVPAADMARLSEYAKEMGASTVFSAGESADAMVELAKAGLKPAQIEAGALSATMAVAATEGLGLAESATIVSNAMTTFRIEGDRAAEVADALAGGSKASTASVASLSEAMSQVGGSARDAGLSLQETVAALAAFDQEGIKGSDAGTSLKTMLARLVPQTSKARKEMDRLGLSFTDANGTFLPLAEIAGQMQRAFVDLSDAERTAALNTIFGADARRAALALIEQGEQGIKDFTAATSDMGAAQRLADARMSGTKGALEELRGALENAGLAAGEAFAPAVVAGADGAAALTNAIVGLPGPVKAAGAALLTIRIADHFGAGPQAAVRGMGSAFDSLRLRTMMAGDAYRSARAGQLEFVGNSGRFVAPVGRMSAALQGLGAAATGAGGALRRGLSGAIGLVGGPWGAALIGGTAILAKFWAEHEEAKARVESLTGSLDAQTGAITDNTREMLFNTLQKEGALDAAKTLGISLTTLRRGLEGDADAMARVNAVVDDHNSKIHQTSESLPGVSQKMIDQSAAAATLAGVLGSTSSELASARDGVRNLGEFMGQSTDVTNEATEATRNYSSELLDARDALNKLIEAEQERANNAVQSRRDQLALDSVMKEARAEAAKGARTLDDSTKAGKANWEMLLDVADQWNQSSDKVRNAKGAYRGMRQEFIDLATDMGATDKRAKTLADRFLTMPKFKIDTKSVDQAREKIKELQALIDGLEQGRKINLGVPLAMGAPSARLNGGPVSAGVPYIVGERRPEVFVPDRPGRIEKDASRFAGGGVTINIDKVIANSGGSFMDEMRSRAGAAVGGTRRVR